MFITHARTAEELKAEVLSDLQRRIDSLEGRSKAYAKSAREKAKYSHTIMELQDMMKFWQELQLIAKVRGRQAIE